MKFAKRHAVVDTETFENMACKIQAAEANSAVAGYCAAYPDYRETVDAIKHYLNHNRSRAISRDVGEPYKVGKRAMYSIFRKT